MIRSWLWQDTAHFKSLKRRQVCVILQKALVSVGDYLSGWCDSRAGVTGHATPKYPRGASLRGRPQSETCSIRRTPATLPHLTAPHPTTPSGAVKGWGDPCGEGCWFVFAIRSSTASRRLFPPLVGAKDGGLPWHGRPRQGGAPNWAQVSPWCALHCLWELGTAVRRGAARGRLALCGFQQHGAERP